MFSFAKNECGIRLISAAIILLPVAGLIGVTSHSAHVSMTVLAAWLVFAAMAAVGFLFEIAEEKSTHRNSK